MKVWLIGGNSMFNSWTYEHVVTLLPTLVVFAIVSVLLGVWLKNRTEKIRLIPIHIVTILLVLLELIKQIKSIIIGYDFSKFPLYYCSLFILLYLATSIYRGKHKDSVRTLTVTTGLTLLVTMLVMPDIIYSSGAVRNMLNDFDDFHTVVYHNLVLLGTMLLLTLDFCKLHIKKDYLISSVFYISYCVIAAPISILSNKNFNHFTYNAVDFIENIRLGLIDIFGYGFGQSIYVLLDLIVTVGFSLIVYTVIVIINRTLCKSDKRQVVIEDIVDEEHKFEN